MAEVAPGIITFGLGDNQTAMIIGQFHLGFYVTVTVPPPGDGGGTSGGSVPLRPGQVQNFYRPLYGDQPIPVSLKISFRDSEIEKIYLMSPRNTDMLVKVVNLLNVTGQRISVAVSNIRNVARRMFARVTNIHKKNEKE